ncbi:MAG: hypothetical protein N4A70_05425 [Pelagimonas sp.]|jgi:hypothetical protein|nr:hypothetical protein [Pelagimonas sp.]
MIQRKRQFEQAQREAASDALTGLSDRAKVHFAISLVLGVEDPEAAAALNFLALRANEMSNVLVREAYERDSAGVA